MTADCKHRGVEVSSGRFGCALHGVKLHAPNGVTLATCAGCFYRNHELTKEERQATKPRLSVDQLLALRKR